MLGPNFSPSMMLYNLRNKFNLLPEIQWKIGAVSKYVLDIPLQKHRQDKNKGVLTCPMSTGRTPVSSGAGE